MHPGPEESWSYESLRRKNGVYQILLSRWPALLRSRGPKSHVRIRNLFVPLLRLIFSAGAGSWEAPGRSARHPARHDRALDLGEDLLLASVEIARIDGPCVEKRLQLRDSRSRISVPLRVRR